MSWISISCWVLQIIIWLGGFICLFIKIHEIHWYTGEDILTGEFEAILIIEIIVYLLYIIAQFCSPSSGYLRHKRSDINIYEKMKKLFCTHPTIQFVCECYHYETKIINTYNSQGRYESRTETKRVVTKVASKFFNFYSARDVSGLFELNFNESSINNKYYLKLELLTDISFADSVTYIDYQKEKEEFCNSN